MILNSIYTVLVIFILIGAGLFISHRKWVDRTTVQAFPKIIINFSMPSLLLVSFTKSFTSEELSRSGLLILAPLAATVVCFFLGRVFASVFKVSKSRRGVFTVLFALSNSVFIGFPVIQSLFGDAGMPYATFFYMANTICFWTLGYYSIKKDAQIITGEISKISIGEIIKKVLNVPLFFVVISVLLVYWKIKLPEVVLKPAEYLGNLTTPLSMIFIGCILYDIGFKKLKMEKDIILVIIGRFAVSGLVMFGTCYLLGIAGLAKDVYIMQMTLPAMTSTTIVSELVKADSEFAAKGMAWTTVLSLITIPLVILIFSGS